VQVWIDGGLATIDLENGKAWKNRTLDICPKTTVSRSFVISLSDSGGPIKISADAGGNSPSTTLTIDIQYQCSKSSDNVCSISSPLTINIHQ
jgi:hypothetical protein